MARALSPSNFAFRAGPTFITGLMLAVLIGLGTWQLHRLQWKEALIAKIEMRLQEDPVDVAVFSDDDPDLRPATASGTFLNDKEIFIYALSPKGESGYDVMTPLRLKDGRSLLVDRGWIPYAQRRGGAFYRTSGEVTIKGFLRILPHFFMQPDNHPEKGEWYGVDLQAMAKADKIDAFLPYVFEADETPNPGGLPEGKQMRITLPNNHLQYAITWYALAGILLVIYLLSSYRKNDAD